MTHPQPPASSLPEAGPEERVGQIVADLDTFYGVYGYDSCKEAARDLRKFAADWSTMAGETVPVAQAPAQAGEVARPGPSGDVPSDFQEGQWWLQKLDEVAAAGTDDFKRAVAVVRNLMRTAHAQVATPPAHPVLAPVVRELHPEIAAVYTDPPCPAYPRCGCPNTGECVR